eukprot:745264-Rhodomonas_salina.4
MPHAMLLRDVRYWPTLSSFAGSGTSLSYVISPLLPYGLLCDVQYSHSVCGCYQEPAPITCKLPRYYCHCPMLVRPSYAVSSTGLAYDATRCAVLTSRMVLWGVQLCCYAVCVNELAYGAMVVLYVVLSKPMVIPDSSLSSFPRQPGPTLCCYALSGTDIAYAAMRCAMLT